MKRIIGVSDQLMGSTNEDPAAGEAVYDPRYMKKKPKTMHVHQPSWQERQFSHQFQMLRENNSISHYFNRIKEDMESGMDR